MSLQNIIITASINSIATQSYGQKTYIASTDEQSFPIEHITGSHAEVWPNFIPGTNYTTDLIVNITQSWQGSIPSIAGDVVFTHNTMDEFYNGEFSGSNHIVTNGSLIDAQCEQFLTVNTTPTNYSIFPYSIYRVDGNIQGTSSFGVFINNLTSPPNGGILMFYESDDYTDSFPTINYKRITYLKISRYDQEGNNNTLSLQELTNIKWTDSTAGIIDLKILNIAEYPTYYLYAVSSKTWVNLSYTDDNILNYSLSASFIGPSASAGLMYLDNWSWDSNKISGGTFNGVWTFDTTPNTSSIYTASITAANYNGSAVTFDFGFWENTYVGNEVYYSPIALTQSVTLNPSQQRTFTLKGTIAASFIGNPNVQYHLETKGLSLPISLSNTFWIITQSVTPQLSTSSVVLEPYLLSNFANSDCDVLMNNYSQNDISNFRKEVIYDNGGSIPSNLQKIINGTAEYAQINDSLYSFSANVIPRYIGVKTVSKNINLPAISGLSNNEISLLSESSLEDNYPTLPNVESRIQYFAYFEQITDNFPKNSYASKAYITKLVDPGGGILPLDSSNKYIIDIESIFPSNSEVKLYYTSFNTTTIETVAPEDSKNYKAIVDEPAIYYKSYFYFRPQLAAPTGSVILNPFGIPIGTSTALPDPDKDGRFDLDLFDPRVLNTTTTTISPYVQQGNLFNSKYNLYSIESGDYDNLYFKYNVTSTSSLPNGATNATYGTGYVMGLALTLTNPFITSSIPSSSFTSYNNYWPIRFNSLSTSSNYEVDTSFLPVKVGDRVRIFNSSLQDDQGNIAYIDDTNILFFADLVGDEGFDFPAQRGMTSYDRKITSITINRPSIFIPIYNP